MLPSKLLVSRDLPVTGQRQWHQEEWALSLRMASYNRSRMWWRAQSGPLIRELSSWPRSPKPKKYPCSLQLSWRFRNKTCARRRSRVSVASRRSSSCSSELLRHLFLRTCRAQAPTARLSMGHPKISCHYRMQMQQVKWLAIIWVITKRHQVARLQQRCRVWSSQTLSC